MQVKDTHKDRWSTLRVAGICLLLQLVVAPNVPMGSGVANFALVFAGVVALASGGRRGVLCGFFGGLLYDMLTTGPIGLMALLLTVFSFLLGSEERNRFADGLVSSLSTYGISSFVVLLVYHLTMLLLGVSEGFVDALMLRTLPTFALSFVSFLPFAYLQARAAGMGPGRGSGLKGVGKRSGGHYDVRNL